MKLSTFKLCHNGFFFVVTILLMDPRSFFGLWFHEIAGLAICLCYILHMVLNWSWIKVTTVRFFRKNAGRSRLNYVMDILLLASFTLIIVSGMAIARMINFSWLGFDIEHRMIYRSIHTSISMLALIIAGIHVGLHWDWITARFGRSARGDASC